ncbi:AEC family transporter [Aquabacterium lacunae]|uniref:AEC family transporter n=1 Tax=Aquabacterium lacunae TaxID=2528630 RepID=A0A4Q9H5A4_9BURK|nr:AEC family transporter [Aquabacterium lacunae]TBO32900.1 AEC family transporter [Aquabacterium lacunae]
MPAFFHYLALCAPMFAIVGLAYLLTRRWRPSPALDEGLTRLLFQFALPGLLFGLMSDLSRLPPVDPRVLLAFFGSCFIVFALARWLAWRAFRLDGVSQSLFALAAIFSNNALLGLPLAQATLGDAAMPTVALVLVFNSLTLWTLVTVSVEWARHGQLNATGFLATLRSVLRNPLILAILSGTAVGLSGWQMPQGARQVLHGIGWVAAPLALFSLGMGLAQHGLKAQWPLSLSMTALKLLLQPLVVWLLARTLGLGLVETQAVVLLGSIAVGANVYLMSRHFQALEGPVAASLVLSTAGSALTTPLVLALVSRGT